MSNTASRVLLIGSDPTPDRVVTRTIGADRVEIERDAEAALRKIGTRTPYDLILYALREQPLSGRQLCEAVYRAYPDDTPMVALISGDAEEASAYSDAGVCVLSKPISETTVRDLLELVEAHATERGSPIGRSNLSCWRWGAPTSGRASRIRATAR